MRIQCIECRWTAGAETDILTCAMCGGLLEVVHRLEKLDGEQLKRLFDERLASRYPVRVRRQDGDLIGGRLNWQASGVWRYKELVHPELDERFIVTRGEGNTGLYSSGAIEAYAGCREVWLKAQSENPSGSFKDNGMTAAVSVGRSLGYSRFACSSTGNTSSSLAMYAAWCGSESYVYVPKEGVAENKVLQTAAYGAKLVSIDGTYDDGLRYLEKESRSNNMYVCNSINPWRIEGQKTMTYELAHAFGWQLPDWIVVPGGALSNVSSIGKALSEMKTIGLIERTPRIALIRAASLPTVASALNIVDPPSKAKAERVLAEFGGVTTTVSDEDILAAKAAVDRSGIGCEPGSAASVAGLRQLVAGGTIGRDESAVCILTGHILKDTDALRWTNRR